MKKAILMILDGYGYSERVEGNAIKAAKTPNLDQLFNKYPSSYLRTSGVEVGLPEGIMGNSEVGHLNIGAGRVVYQLNTLIDKKIKEKDFFENESLLNAIKHAKDNNSKLHLFGLLSDGGVHSSLKHLWAFLELCSKENVEEVFYHVFTDGRDTSPTSGSDFMKTFLEKSKEIGVGKVATISGRYYAMDRDNRWERIEKAYRAIVDGQGNRAIDPISAIKESYTNQITDEFILPTVMMEENKPVAKVEENDSIVFFNFRADRAREITKTFIYDDFSEFSTSQYKNLKYTTFTPYEATFEDYVSVAFRPLKLDNILGKVMEDIKYKQLRIAETEKYAHVTFFFNGGVEEPFEGEDRILIPSPKIPSYDLQPEMSAYLVKDKLVEKINSEEYDLIIVNFANCDMVGHTGVFDAAVKAVEAVDSCVGEVFEAAQNKNYQVILTADHGNADKMLDMDGNVFTAHSKNVVPIVVAVDSEKEYKINQGKLSDVAPTLLKIMNIDIPREMTGKVLIEFEK